MTGIILLLYLSDETYGKRLLRYLTGKRNPLLCPELVTEESAVNQRDAGNKGEIVVLTDYAGIREHEGRRVIFLSGDARQTENSIFMYQKAEKIYTELLVILKLDKKAGASSEHRPAKEKKTGVFCILDPEGKTGSVLAVLLSQYLGRQGKCLYLNLSGFPLYYGGELQEQPDFTEKGLGELLFCMEEPAGRVDGLARPFGYAKLIVPFPHYKDLLDCGGQEWDKLLKRLCRECGFESIVIELGQLFEHTLELMAQSEYPCLIESPDVCGRVRTSVFRHYCRLEHKEALISSCFIVPAINDSAGRTLLAERTPQELGSDTFLMEQIGGFLSGLSTGGGDDIVYEEEE